MAEEFYWVVQVIGGQPSFNGPYRTRKAAELRADRIQGGEVHVMRSWTDNPQLARDEFMAEAAS